MPKYQVVVESTDTVKFTYEIEADNEDAAEEYITRHADSLNPIDEVASGSWGVLWVEEVA